MTVLILNVTPTYCMLLSRPRHKFAKFQEGLRQVYYFTSQYRYQVSARQQPATQRQSVESYIQSGLRAQFRLQLSNGRQIHDKRCLKKR